MSIMSLTRIIICIVLCYFTTTITWGSPDTAEINRMLIQGRSMRTSNPDSSIMLSHYTLDLSEKAGYVQGILTSYNNIGMSYWAKGDFSNGIEYMHKMIKKATLEHDSIEIATAYGNCAILYIDMGDMETGLNFSKKAIEIYLAAGDSINPVHNINNIGWIYYAMDKYDSAIVYYDSAIAGYKKYFKDVSWLGQAYANVSDIYYELNKPGETLQYAQKGLATCRTADYNQKAKGHAYLSVSKAHLLLKRYRTAIEYADSALQIADTTNIHTLTAEAYWLKYKAYENLGNYKTAIAFMELNRKWTDSLLNQETNATLTAIKTQLATEKKDKELVIKEKELAESTAARQQNLFYLALASLLVVFISITAYLLYKRQQLRIEAKNKQLKIEQQEKEVIGLELNNQQIKNEELNKELLTFTLTTAQKNQLLQDINDELNNVSDAAQLRKVKHIINAAMGNEADWEEFKVRFEQVHQSFFDKLKTTFPQLTANDLRLCAFIKLNLNSKQVASLLNIAPSSVDISKYRLKKKLNLEKEDNLNDFIAEI